MARQFDPSTDSLALREQAAQQDAPATDVPKGKDKGKGKGKGTKKRG